MGKLAAGIAAAALVVGVVVYFAVFAAAAVSGGGAGPLPALVDGIPPRVLDAYQQAAAVITEIKPHCEGMRWSILAGVGQVESNHAAGVEIDEDGWTDPWIIGPRLDGSGAGGNTTPHYDTDEGDWDLDTAYDRAVGPMQFLPSTFAGEGLSQRGDPDGPHPHNVYDAALTAASYLCGSAGSLGDYTAVQAALLRYNNSLNYVATVMEHIIAYDQLGDVTSDGPSIVADIAEIRARADAFVEASAAGLPDPFYGSTHYYRLCGRLAARVHGHAHSGHVSAIAQWDAHMAAGTAHPGDPNPPPGALVFWDNPGDFGHVGVYLGDGLVVSNDIYDTRAGQGGVYIAPLSEFSNGRWGLPYLGWAPPVYGSAG